MYHKTSGQPLADVPEGKVFHVPDSCTSAPVIDSKYQFGYPSGTTLKRPSTAPTTPTGEPQYHFGPVPVPTIPQSHSAYSLSGQQYGPGAAKTYHTPRSQYSLPSTAPPVDLTDPAYLPGVVVLRKNVNKGNVSDITTVIHPLTHSLILWLHSCGLVHSLVYGTINYQYYGCDNKL